MAVAQRSHSTIRGSVYIPQYMVHLGGCMYIVLEDVIRDQGFVDARVLVGLEMDERIFRDTLMHSLLCRWGARQLNRTQ